MGLSFFDFPPKTKPLKDERMIPYRPNGSDWENFLDTSCYESHRERSPYSGNGSQTCVFIYPLRNQDFLGCSGKSSK